MSTYPTSDSRRILLVDDEPLFGKTTAALLKQRGLDVVLCDCGSAGLNQLSSSRFDLVIADLNMPGNLNLEFLTETRSKYPDLPLIVLTGCPSLPSAIESVRLGIHDYLLKPIELKDLLHSIERALPLQPEKQTAGNAFENILGNSVALQSLKELSQRVAVSNANVLISGESGTGKELLARAIHACSPRAHSPLVTIDCSAIPENLLESMLFGHIKGSFTGATETRRGLLATADQGTLFLDEVGELPLALQAKLLRVIQFGTFIPIGGNEEAKVNVRVLSATNRKLTEEVAQGRFRQDLYYRLAVLELTIPPLRERSTDITLLAQAFLERIAKRDSVPQKSLSPTVLESLVRYNWPGNIRELNNVMERCVCLTTSTVIDLDDLPIEISQYHSQPIKTPLDKPATQAVSAIHQSTTREGRIEAVDREYLDGLLRRHRGNVSRAAAEAKLTRQGLHKALIRLGLNAQSYRQPK